MEQKVLSFIIIFVILFLILADRFVILISR